MKRVFALTSALVAHGLWAAEAPVTAGLAVVDRVRFFPATNRATAMVGGKFTGSNVSAFDGYKVLAEIKTAPQSGAWAELAFTNATPSRWVRYEAPAGSHGNIAELEFYAGQRRLGGAGFGSPGYCGRASIGRARSTRRRKRFSTRTTRTANLSASTSATRRQRRDPPSCRTGATGIGRNA